MSKIRVPEKLSRSDRSNLLACWSTDRDRKNDILFTVKLYLNFCECYLTDQESILE